MPAQRFVTLSGPSCVGKGPLVAALNRFHPDVEYESIPVIKSRESRPNGPRPEEGDVWEDPDFFRHKSELVGLEGNPRYLVGDCRGLPQAVDLEKVRHSKAGLVFVEIYHAIGAQLAASTFLGEMEIMMVFLSPIGKQEIEDLRTAGVALDDYLTQIMLHKQLVRARYQGKTIDTKLVDDALGRAKDTIAEVRSACKYSHVIVNRDGEGSPNWHRLPKGLFTQKPEGDAGRAVDALLRILCMSEDTKVENWRSLVL